MSAKLTLINSSPKFESIDECFTKKEQWNQVLYQVRGLDIASEIMPLLERKIAACDEAISLLRKEKFASDEFKKQYNSFLFQNEKLAKIKEFVESQNHHGQFECNVNFLLNFEWEKPTRYIIGAMYSVEIKSQSSRRILHFISAVTSDLIEYQTIYSMTTKELDDEVFLPQSDKTFSKLGCTSDTYNMLRHIINQIGAENMSLAQQKLTKENVSNIIPFPKAYQESAIEEEKELTLLEKFVEMHKPSPAECKVIDIRPKKTMQKNYSRRGSDDDFCA